MKERLTHWRERVRQRRSTNAVYRTMVGITGAVVLAGGIVAIPYPGPGWAIVFVGLAILASEFAWAHHTLRFAKGRYDGFMDWFGGQSLWLRGVGALLTTLVVVGTLWMVGAVDTVAGWAGVDRDWMQSPIGLGS